MGDDPTNHLFIFSPEQLSELFEPRDLHKLTALGGLNGLAKGLKTSPINGLRLSSNGQPELYEARKRIFSTNKSHDKNIFKNISLAFHKKPDSLPINVIRSGKPFEISYHEILVGEVVYLEPSDIIPTDGILVSSENLACDESVITGDREAVVKTPAAEAIAGAANESVHELDPFIMAGTRVLRGTGCYLVTAVGRHTVRCRLLR